MADLISMGNIGIGLKVNTGFVLTVSNFLLSNLVV